MKVAIYTLTCVGAFLATLVLAKRKGVAKVAFYAAACVGALVMTLSLADTLGIGHFGLYFGLTPIECHAVGYST